jgi:hypothetical protein
MVAPALREAQGSGHGLRSCYLTLESNFCIQEMAFLFLSFAATSMTKSLGA